MVKWYLRKEKKALKMKAKTKTTAICILCAALMATLLLAGCGAQTAEPQSIEAAESTPEPTPTPEPSPTPTPEPELPAGVSVTVDGTALSGSVVSGDVTYVSTEEFFAALGIDYTESDGMIELTWRGGELSLGGEGTELLSYRGAGYLPVMAVCEQMGISLLDDVEQNHLYCTPAAGDWVVPEGYRVPVFMYHYVAEDVPYDSQRVLSVRPSEMEEQLKYIVDNGYQPIWFEDLEHVDEYEKPIILTFDDGRLDNYTILYPLLQKYNVKATFFIITDSMNYNGGVSCMTPGGFRLRPCFDTEPYDDASGAGVYEYRAAGGADVPLQARPYPRDRKGAVRFLLPGGRLQRIYAGDNRRLLPLRNMHGRQGLCHRRGSV